MDTPLPNTPLTQKQLHFCRVLAAGGTQAAAYREAYNVAEGKGTATHQQAASRLMRKTQVRARVERLIRERERAISSAAVSDREKVLGKLRAWMCPETVVLEDGTTQKDLASASELKAAELLGKSVGLFRDVIEDSRGRTADEIQGELEARLMGVIDDSDPVAETEDELIDESAAVEEGVIASALH